MKRFFTTVSSTILATGLVILPIASFAQGSDKSTAPAAQSTMVQPSGTQTAQPATTAKTDVKPEVKTIIHGDKTHGMTAGKTNDATVKTPAANSQVKG